MVWNPKDTDCTVCGYPTEETRVRGISIARSARSLPPDTQMIGDDRINLLARVCGQCGNVQLRVPEPALFDVSSAGKLVSVRASRPIEDDKLGRMTFEKGRRK